MLEEGWREERKGMEGAPTPCQYRYRHVALAAPVRGALPVVKGIHLVHGVSHYWCVQAHPSEQLEAWTLFVVYVTKIR